MTICKKAPWWIVNVDDPQERYPASCKRYSCGICLITKIRERVRVATWAAIQTDHVRHVILTRVPATWQQARNQLRDLTRRLRKAYKWEWVWAIEENPRKTGYHCHGMQHGEYVPKRRLQELWGGRIVYIKTMDKDGATYLAKIRELAGYLAKDLKKGLSLNGGRCLHMSRGFLHGLRERDVLRKLRGDKRWILVPAMQSEIASGGAMEEC